MLNLLRRYQKTLFAVVAVITTASFIFFGTYSVMQSPTTVADYPVGKTIDGKQVTSQQLQLLIRFLNTSSQERQLFEKGTMPNLLNDGVVQKDFLETGFAMLLGERFFELFKSEQEKKFERIKRFHPYEHPQAPFLSAKSLWNDFAPTLVKDYEALLQRNEMDIQGFGLLCSLYTEQTKIPPDMLRQILQRQQEQLSWLKKDPILERGDLSLFGFNTMEDWLGRQFLTLAAETVLNGAATALSEGYRVSLTEARASLKENLRKAVISLANREWTPKEIDELYHRQVNELFWGEEQVVETWRKVLLFRKFLAGMGQHVIVDSQTLERSAQFASETVNIDLFRLPPSLELNTFRDLLKLQVYLEAVSAPQTKKGKQPLLSLPTLFASLKEIEKDFPELIEKSYDVEIQEVSINTLAEKVSLKEAYQWQFSEQHAAELKRRFPALQNYDTASFEQRHEILAKLPVIERAEIDLFTKKKIVQEHPEWMEEAFIKAPKKHMVFGLRIQGGELPFKGAIDHSELSDYLEKASPGTATPYTADGEHHYRITLQSPPGASEIVTFSVASKDGTLDLLLDRYLSQIYPEVRKKHPALFAQKDGGFKPLKEVQDLVGAEAFAEVLHYIEEESKHYGVIWTDQMKHSLDPFAKYRLITYVQQMRDALSNGMTEEGLVRSNSSSRETFSNQWHLIKEQKLLKRKEAAREHLEKLFDEKETLWSQPQVNGIHGPYFYYVRQKLQQTSDIDALVEKRREILSLDMQRMFFVELLEKMASKGLIMTSKTFQKGIEEEA